MKRPKGSGLGVAWRRPAATDPVSTRLMARLVAALATWIAATGGLLLIDMSWLQLVQGGSYRVLIYLCLFFMAFGLPSHGATLLLMRRCKRL